MSHGVVPAISSLRGPTGYFSGSGEGSPSGAVEERQSLLQPARSSPSSSGSAAAGGKAATLVAPKPAHAVLDIAPSSNGASSSGGGSGSHQMPRRLTFASVSSSSSARHGGQQPLHGVGGLLDGSGRQAASRSDKSSSSDAAGASSLPNYESLDYDVIDNTVFRTDTASRTHLDHITRSGVKWSLCFVLGVITAAAAFAVNLGVENLAGVKFWAALALLRRGQGAAAFLAYTATNCLLVCGSVYVTTTYAPAAAGSGIAEVKAYLNGIDVPGLFQLNTLVVKLAGSVGAVAGGLAVGKEGPFVHAGACLGALLSQGGTATRHLPWFKRFWNDRDRADLVACGAAAGVAAAFRAPVGGVLFALEEMTSWWRNQLLWYAFFTTAVVSVAVRTLMRVCSEEQAGSCGFFGAGGFSLYEITEGQENFEFSELLPMLLLGVLGGLLGSAFNHLNARLAAARKASLLRHGRRGRLLEGLAAALLTSLVSFVLPLMVACQPCPADVGAACPRAADAHSGNFVHAGCPAGEASYNDMATLFFNTQDDAIRNLFSSQTRSEYSVPTLAAFAAIFFLLAVLSYGLALPTGLFVPSILTGAAYGRLVGVFVAGMRPGTHAIDEGTYALLGAASFLGGCMRMTVATAVMLLELTNNLALLPMMMLVTLVAKAVGDGTGMKPIYESLIDLKRLPFLEPSPHGLMRHVTAAEAAGQPALTFSRVERVGVIADVLRSTRHNGFVVLSPGVDNGSGGANGGANSAPRILGTILRSQLLVLLSSRRCFQPTPFVSEVAGRVAFSYEQSDFARPISGSGGGSSSSSELSLLSQLSDGEAAMFIDLGPYVNPNLVVVQEDTSLSKVYTMFRSLGLRHVAVVPRASQVLGIITRHDLRADALEERCLEQLALGAGAAGLATALRGTVIEALDAYKQQTGATPPPSQPSHSPRGPAASSGGAPAAPQQQRRGSSGATAAAAAAAAAAPAGAAPRQHSPSSEGSWDDFGR